MPRGISMVLKDGTKGIKTSAMFNFSLEMLFFGKLNVISGFSAVLFSSETSTL